MAGHPKAMRIATVWLWKPVGADIKSSLPYITWDDINRPFKVDEPPSLPPNPFESVAQED